MSKRLTYEFAPIDVILMTHPRACAAGPEAMGLWLWGQCYARVHKTGGVVQRSSMMAAWGGKRNDILAKRLVDAGLWIPREDGDWDIHNFEEKSSSRSTSSSTERMRELRKRRKEAVPLPNDGGSDVTGDVTFVTSDASRDALCSPSLSPSLSISSDLKIPEEIPSAREEPEALPEPTPMRWSRGPTAERALETFAGAITAVTGVDFVVARAPFLRDDICAVMNRLAPRGELGSALGWLGDTTQAWCRADPDCTDRKPSRLMDWLNAGKPDRTRPRGRAERQPHDTEWLERMQRTGTGGDL